MKCEHCHGRGYFDECQRALFPGQVDSVWRRPCTTCKGLGRVKEEEDDDREAE